MCQCRLEERVVAIIECTSEGDQGALIIDLADDPLILRS